MVLIRVQSRDDKSFPSVEGPYWNADSVRPILFSQALTTALVQNRSVEALIEIGAHLALKRPVSMNIQDVLSREIPYTGLLHRGENLITALADSVGYLWTHLGEHTIDLTSFTSFMQGGVRGMLVKNLPAYQCDHDRAHWHESRISRVTRRRRDRFYASLTELGYGYTGPFRALSCLERKCRKASGLLTTRKSIIRLIL